MSKKHHRGDKHQTQKNEEDMAEMTPQSSAPVTAATQASSAASSETLVTGGTFPEGTVAPAPNSQRAQFIVNGQYIKDLSFENPNIFRMMQQTGEAQPEVNIDLGVNVQGISEGGYEVTLQIRVETKRENITGFIIELTYAGLVTLVGWPPEQVEPILFVEGPKLLFPFARQIISVITQNGGFPPLNLNPIDFTELYQRRLAQAREKAQGSGLVN